MSTILPINLDDLLHARAVESARLELKEAWNEGPTKLQVLHTICAFANDLQNLNGGYLVIGVAEDNGVAVLPPTGLPASELDSIQKKIRGSCKLLVPEYQPVLSPEVVDGRHILVIWAPGSDIRPHTAPATLKVKGAPRDRSARAPAPGICRTPLVGHPGKHADPRARSRGLIGRSRARLRALQYHRSAGPVARGGRPCQCISRCSL